MTDVVSPIIDLSKVEVKQSPVVKPTDVVVPEAPSADPPLSKYSEINGKPYTVDYLKIFFWNALNPELDVNKVRENVGGIEQFVSDEIQDKHYEDTVESYREIMNKAKEAMEISDNETVESKIEKIKTYIKVIKKHQKAKKKDSYLTQLAKNLKSTLKAGAIT